jgi:co-chaperonin GroES (HSP10)
MQPAKVILKGTGLVLAGVVTAAIFGGCATEPAEKQVFIPPEYASMMKRMSRESTRKTWGDPKAIPAYNKIQVAVIVSNKQLKASSWANMHIRSGSKKQDLNALAVYAANSFKKAFAKSKRFQLVDKPGAKTLALEFAIVQAIPNKPVLGAISNLTNLTPIGAILSPIKLANRGAGSNTTGGVIAMETMLRDSQSGKVIAVVADRAKSKTAYFNTKDFTAYGGARQVVDMWTKQMVKALDYIQQNGRRPATKADSKFSFFN